MSLIRPAAAPFSSTAKTPFTDAHHDALHLLASGDMQIKFAGRDETLDEYIKRVEGLFFGLRDVGKKLEVRPLDVTGAPLLLTQSANHTFELTSMESIASYNRQIRSLVLKIAEGRDPSDVELNRRIIALHGLVMVNPFRAAYVHRMKALKSWIEARFTTGLNRDRLVNTLILVHSFNVDLYIMFTVIMADTPEPIFMPLLRQTSLILNFDNDLLNPLYENIKGKSALELGMESNFDIEEMIKKYGGKYLLNPPYITL